MRYWSWIVSMLLAGCGGPDRAQRMPAQNEAAAPRADSTSEAVTQIVEENANACLAQNGERIPDNAIRAIGTEPFWGADVEGRCVTYSTPEDQDGTRIWTKFSGTAENGRWTGALDGRPFVMVTREQKGCSDGMSDNLYPIGVTLTVRGEQRTGCAISKAEWEKRKPA